MFNILIIDDEEAMRDSCLQVLTGEGYQVETAGDGKTGLQKVKELKPDLILVDLKMPGICGMEVLEKTRDIDPNIIAVVITGFATIDSAVESMKQGAYDFLPKPFTPDELRIIVKRGLEKRRLAVEAAALREEKRRMEENFITMISHELRTPLVDIQQYFEVILSGIAGEIGVEQKKMLERVRKKINILLNLINDWLKMTRIKAGEVVKRFKPLDISSVLKDVVDYMRPQAIEKGVDLKIDTSAKLKKVKGDRESLKIMFSNLVSNGIRFNHKGGRVFIKVVEQDSLIRVEISDTGIGINKENTPFIFDEFFRVKSNETKEIDGIGLGLSIVRKIVDMHSGSIEVESRLGKGSTFYINLPKNNKEPD